MNSQIFNKSSFSACIMFAISLFFNLAGAKIINFNESIEAPKLKAQMEKVYEDSFYAIKKDFLNQTKRKISIEYENGPFCENAWEKLRIGSYKNEYDGFYLAHFLIQKNNFRMKDGILSFLDFFRIFSCNDKAKMKVLKNNKKKYNYYSYTNHLGNTAEICMHEMIEKKDVYNAYFKFEKHSNYKKKSNLRKEFINVVIMSTCVISFLDINIIHKLVEEIDITRDFYISITEDHKDKAVCNEVKTYTNDYKLSNYFSIDLGNETDFMITENAHEKSITIIPSAYTKHIAWPPRIPAPRDFSNCIDDPYIRYEKNLFYINIVKFSHFKDSLEEGISFTSPFYSSSFKKYKKNSSEMANYQLTIGSLSKNFCKEVFIFYGDKEESVINKFCHIETFIKNDLFNEEMSDQELIEYDIYDLIRNIKETLCIKNLRRNFYNYDFDFNEFNSRYKTIVDFNTAKSGYKIIKYNSLSNEYLKNTFYLCRNTLSLLSELTKEFDITLYSFNRKKSFVSFQCDNKKTKQ